MLRQIASLAPKAGRAVSRFAGHLAFVMLPRLVSRFMAVARPRKKAKGGGAASASNIEITSSFLTSSGTTSGDGTVDGADLGSMFLAPPLAPRPQPPRTVRRRLRSRFRTRQFMKPPWMR